MTILCQVKILLFEGKADVSLKSINGCDALFIACQHGSINNAFLMLHYADANPNCVNVEGDTPLYWLLKYRCRESLDLQRLLLRYNASVSHLDHNENNALHIIMGLAGKADLNSAKMVYESGGESLLTKNKQGLTPDKVCKINGSDYLVSFMEDIWYHSHLPKWIPTVVSAALIVSVFTVAHFLGLVYSMPVIFLMGFGWYKLSQSTIISHVSRQSHGFAWGIIITIVGSYYIFLIDKLPFYWAYVTTFISIIICSSLYLTATIPPITLTDTIDSIDMARNKLAEDLIKTGYPDGPTPPPLAEIPIHIPKLCTTCLVDKSHATTHCAQCNICVISLDHHCVFVNNCVGLGNRLVFVYFTISASLGCLLYVFLSLAAEYSYYCPYVGNGSSFKILFKELCMMNINPSLALIKWMSFICVIWIGAIGIGQLVMIAGETTTYETTKGRNHRHRICACNQSSLNNLMHFFTTGGYKVDSKTMESSFYPSRFHLSDGMIAARLLSIIDRCKQFLTRGLTTLRYKLNMGSGRHHKHDEESQCDVIDARV
jgi:hypothetical protein